MHIVILIEIYYYYYRFRNSFYIYHRVKFEIHHMHVSWLKKNRTTLKFLGFWEILLIPDKLNPLTAFLDENNKIRM